MTGFRNTVPTAGTEEKDETYKRIVGKKHVPDIDKGELMFRLVSAAPEDFGHYMKFWLNIGLKENGDFVSLPRVSPNPFTDFIVSDGRGGTRIGRTAAAAKGCPLSKLAENNHPIINLSDYKDSKGNPKKNIDPVHVARIQVIERKRDANGRPIKNADGSPALLVHPEEMLLEFPQSWWDQFVNIVDPAPQAQVENDLRETVAPKKLPTADLTKVVWMVYKQKRTKNPTGDPKKDIDYIVDFASKTVLTQVPAVADPVDIHKAYQVPTAEDLERWVAKAAAGFPRDDQAAAGGQSGAPGHAQGGDEDDPEAYGQRVGAPGAAQAPAAPPASGGRDF